MENFEMATLQETGRVVEKMADFAGSVILQLMQKQGIKALLDHIWEGGSTLTTVVSEQRAEDFKELMKTEHIPYVEIEHMDPNTKEKAKLQEEMSVSEESKTGNRVVNYMLQLEERDREMIRSGNKHVPDYYNEVQKEALKRFATKMFKEQVLNVEKKNVLPEKSVDKRMLGMKATELEK